MTRLSLFLTEMDEQINLPKYRVVTEPFTSNASLFEEKINELTELGYRVSQLATVRPVEGWTDGEYIAIMSLSSTVNYEGATNFVNLEFDKNTEDGTPLIEKMLAEGWKPINHYSKHVTLMKVNPDGA